MAPLSRRLLLVFATLGLGASAVSSYVHYQLLTQPGYTSFCDVSERVSCTDAYTSRFGSLAGVPVALGGVVFFALVIVLVVFARRPGSTLRETAPAYIFALSTVALAFVLYLAWAAFFILKAVCLLCAGTYVAVIAIFIISGGATTFPMTTLPGRARRDVRALISSPLALVILLLFVAGAATLVASFPRESSTARPAVQAPPLTDEQRAQIARWYDVQPKVTVPVEADGAKVVIVKFNDFQCPPCRATYEAFKSVIERHTATGAVKFVLKHYPLEGECNASAMGGTHTAACEAAGAYVLARGKGTSAKLEEWLFGHQSTLTPDVVRQAARDVAGLPDFEAQYARALQEVRTDASLGQLLGVKSTPTFFINGHRISQGFPPQVLEAIIDLELKRAQ